MAINYTKLAATAKRLIEVNGRTVTFLAVSTELVDTDKPWDGVEPTDPTETLAKAVFLEDTTFDEAGTMVPRKNIGMVIAPATDLDGNAMDLSTYDFVSDGGKPRKITRRLELKPGDTTLAWFLEVGR